MNQINLSYDFDDKMQVLQLILLDNSPNNLSQSETTKDFTNNLQEINIHGQNVVAQGEGSAGGDQDFLSKVFGDEDKENFEKYLESYVQTMGGTNQQSANFGNQNISASNNNNNYKKKKEVKIINKEERVPKPIRYREVNRSPRTLFNYHGIDIQVLYQFYDSFHANCLVMPYSQISTNNLTKLGLNKSVISSIFRAYDYRTIQQVQDNEGLLAVNCKRDFKDHNYNWLYLFKKPYFKYIQEYSIKKLETFVSFTIEKACKYKSNESLAFPDFEWLGISCPLKCEVFFSTLTKAIFEQQKKRKLSLKKISVCCSTKQSFFSFNTKLRELSDIYMFNEMVPLVRSWANK